MPNTQDYYALMQMLQASNPPKQRLGQRVTGAVTGVAEKLMPLLQQHMAQQKIQGALADAEKSGKKVSYTIDPNTGVISPTISDAPNVYEFFKDNPQMKDDYEVVPNASGKPSLRKKKQVASKLIAGIKSALEGENDAITIKNPATGQDEILDRTKEADVDKIMDYLGIEDWRNNKELADAGIQELYDTKLQGWTAAKTEKAAKEKKKGVPDWMKEAPIKAIMRSIFGEGDKERVAIISPDGKKGTIPKSQLDEALKVGYKSAK